MTNSMIASSNAGFFGSIERKAPLWSGIGRAWADFTTYRRTLAELRALTDKQLGDLGLSRDTLRTTAHTAVYGY